jgi:hypothetical protein
MPALSLGWLLSASHMRIVRSSMSDALDTEYVKIARLKALPQRLVIWKHAFKNATIPVFTLFAVNFAHLSEFSGPGHSATAALLRDRAGRIAKVPLHRLVAALDPWRRHQFAGDGE